MTEFVRSHPLEGQGCRANFFNFLLRCGRDTPAVRIPDTVVFEHGYPRWWYSYDSKTEEARRIVAQGKELHAKNLLAHFVENTPKKHGKAIDCVATYTYNFDDPRTDETLVRVEYHTAESLEEFLYLPNDPRKKDGILQSVVIPVEDHYTVTSVSWSPDVHVVRRRSSAKTIIDTRATLRERFVTFDGPDYFSNLVNVAEDTKAYLLGKGDQSPNKRPERAGHLTSFQPGCCVRIAEFLTKAHHLKVAAMQLFFVIGRDSEPVLLWCGSLFFVNPQIAATNVRVPEFLLRGAVFADEAREVAERELQLELKKTAQKEKAVIRSARGEKSVSKKKKEFVSRFDERVKASDLTLDTGKIDSVETTAKQITEHEWSKWYDVSDDIRHQYDVIGNNERTAVNTMNDMFYMAMSHFQVQGAPPLMIEVPFELSRCLGTPERVKELLLRLGLDESAAEGGGTVCFLSPQERMANPVDQHPITKMQSDALAWIQAHFDDRRRTLRQDCMPALQLAVARACVKKFISTDLGAGS